jgi:mono/diheme cytochrome c family protein/cytochrome c551/c552
MTNLKILAVVLGTVGVYTLIANAIPQVESDVPRELTFSGEVTAEELVAAGEELFDGAGGCTACHGLGTRAPNLLTADASGQAIGARCATRVEGADCKAYLHQSMIEPNVYVVEGFQPIMPDVRRTLSNEQIWALVAFLQAQGGEVTVTGEDIASTAGEADVEAASATQAAAASGQVDPGVSNPVGILEQFACLACHRLGELGQEVGPPFTDIGARRDADYIRRSIVDPDAEIAEGYQQFAGIMPKDFGQRMTWSQLEVLVEYLAEQRGP